MIIYRNETFVVDKQVIEQGPGFKAKIEYFVDWLDGKGARVFADSSEAVTWAHAHKHTTYEH